MPDLDRIVCAIDLSDRAEEVVAWAMDLATQSKASVVLVSVVEDFFPYTEIYKSLQEMGVAKAIEEVRSQITTELEQFAATHREAGIEVDTMVRTGHPDREIVAVASEVGADLIVIGSHGRTGIDHALLGSVAEKVLRKAACPVLTVKQPAAD